MNSLNVQEQAVIVRNPVGRGRIKTKVVCLVLHRNFESNGL